MDFIMKFSYLGIMYFDHTHSVILSFPTSNKLLLLSYAPSPLVFPGLWVWGESYTGVIWRSIDKWVLQAHRPLSVATLPKVLNGPACLADWITQIRNYSKLLPRKVLRKRMWAKEMRNSSDIVIFKNYHGSLTWEGVWYFWLLDYETIKNKTPETVFQSLSPMLFHCFTAKIHISPQLTSSLPKVIFRGWFCELWPRLSSLSFSHCL